MNKNENESNKINYYHNCGSKICKPTPILSTNDDELKYELSLLENEKKIQIKIDYINETIKIKNINQ